MLENLVYNIEAVSRKRRRSLIRHRAGNIIFCSRPSLSDTPACRQAAGR